LCGGGLDIIKLTKTPLIYNVSRFNSGGLGALFGELSPPKSPVATGLEGGLDIIKLTKPPLIYSVSRFNLGVLEALFGRT